MDGTSERREVAAAVGGGADRYLVGVVGGGAAALDAVRGHHGSQVVSLHQQLVQVLAALLVDVDDGSGHLGDALDHHLQGGGGTISQGQGRGRKATWCGVFCLFVFSSTVGERNAALLLLLLLQDQDPILTRKYLACMNSSVYTVDTKNQIQNASCKTLQKVLMRSSPLVTKCHSAERVWFTPVIIPNDVHVHTCSCLGSSPLHVPAASARAALCHQCLLQPLMMSPLFGILKFQIF